MSEGIEHNACRRRGVGHSPGRRRSAERPALRGRWTLGYAEEGHAADAWY